MTFENLEWLYFAVPLLLLMVALRFWRRHFWGYSLVEHLGDEIGPPNPLLRIPRMLEALAIGFLLVALLGPVYPFSLNRIERGGLQIIFVLDLSQSMEEAIARGNAPPPPRPGVVTIQAGAPPGAPPAGPLLATPGSKMEAVKITALEFVQQRKGDAIGLVVFSNNGYLVSPATFDHESLSQYLLMTGTHTLVNEGFTAIGEGLFTANSYFTKNRDATRRRRAKGNVIVILTDGDNNYGRDPLVEVERARSEGTRIYMIGVALQPGASQQIANAVPSTGGRYFDARNPQHLEQVFSEINDVEKGVFYTLQLRRNEPAYFVFVLLALGCLALRLIMHGIPHFVELS
ncbi:MAG TPA: VWA domain-containing protein [Terriglobia bacterium]|jgi:Mg-chelatase subunit ChlD